MPAPGLELVVGRVPEGRRRDDPVAVAARSSSPCGSRGCRGRWRGRRCSASQERLVGEVRVLAEDHLAQQEVAQRVERRTPQRGRPAARRCRPTSTSSRRPSATSRARRSGVGSGRPGRHQEGRPVDGVEAEDVLADQVHVGAGQYFAESRVAPVVPCPKPERGDVVGQRVEPDVDRRAPDRPGTGMPHVNDVRRDAQVAQARVRRTRRISLQARRPAGRTRGCVAVVLEQRLLRTSTAGRSSSPRSATRRRCRRSGTSAPRRSSFSGRRSRQRAQYQPS